MGVQLRQPFSLPYSKLAASRWDLLPVLDAVCSPSILTFILQCISVLGWDSLVLNLQGKTGLLCAALPSHFQGSH